MCTSKRYNHTLRLDIDPAAELCARCYCTQRHGSNSAGVDIGLQSRSASIYHLLQTLLPVQTAPCIAKCGSDESLPLRGTLINRPAALRPFIS